jgi:hypothetical protein
MMESNKNIHINVITVTMLGLKASNANSSSNYADDNME